MDNRASLQAAEWLTLLNHPFIRHSLPILKFLTLLGSGTTYYEREH